MISSLQTASEVSATAVAQGMMNSSKSIQTFQKTSEVVAKQTTLTWTTELDALPAHMKAKTVPEVQLAFDMFSDAASGGLNDVKKKIDGINSSLKNVVTNAGAAADALNNVDGDGKGGGGRGGGGNRKDRLGLAEGTGGFVDFGTGTDVTLHGMEAVVPADQWSAAPPPGSDNGEIVRALNRMITREMPRAIRDAILRGATRG
jgi:hypothetical protein